MEILVSGKTLPEAYHKALIELEDHGEIFDCGDWGTRQKECSITIAVDNPICEPMISHYFIGGPEDLEQYVEEMLDGILDFEVGKGNWNYTYHQRMVENNQIDFVINELKRNPESRRAVVDIRNPSDIGSDDPACLQHIQYFIRHGKLDCKVLFRSNDAVKATFMNAFALVMLQKQIASKLGTPVGTYTHRANSFHAYEKDWSLLSAYVKRIINEDRLYYSYADEWKEYMDDCKAAIARKVRELKNK